MDYKIREIRSYNDYIANAEDEIYLAADALIEECEGNEGCEADRENIINAMQHHWYSQKARLGSSPIFDSMSKFEIEITNLAQEGSDRREEGVKRWFLGSNPRMMSSFDDQSNYENFLTEKALRLPAEGGTVLRATADQPSNELEVLVRKVLYIMELDYTELISSGKERALREGVVEPFLANEYALAVYKMFYQSRLIMVAGWDSYAYRNFYSFLSSTSNWAFQHFNRALSEDEVYCLESNSLEELNKVPKGVTLLDVGQSFEEVLSEQYYDSSATTRSWKISPEVAADGEITALWWHGANTGTTVGNDYYLGVRKSLVELDVDIALTNKIYETMMAAFYEYLPKGVREPLKGFFTFSTDTVFDNKIVIQEWESEYDTNSAIMLWFHTLMLEFVKVASEGVDYIVSLPSRPTPRHIFNLPEITVNKTLAEKVNRASTLNKQLQMLLRDFLQQHWSVLSGVKGKFNKDFHFQPEFIVSVPESHKENLLLQCGDEEEVVNELLRRSRVRELRKTAVWQEMREAIHEGTKADTKRVLSVIKRKKVLQESFLFKELNDCLKIKDAGRYLLPDTSTWIVSLEVPDILTASINTNNWSSCHAGSYANSPMVYGANTTTFIVYQKGSEDTWLAPGHSVDSKTKRAYVHYGYNSQGGAIVVEDAYPSSDRVILEILPLILAEMAGIESRTIEPFQFDQEDLYDMIITGYFDSIETDTSVGIGDFELHPCEVFDTVVPAFSDDGYIEEWYYGEYGSVDAYANW